MPFRHPGVGMSTVMGLRHAVVVAGSAVAVLAIVAGCTSGSDGNVTPTASATVTRTSTATVPATTASSGTSPASTAPVGVSSTPRTSASGPGLCTPTVTTFRVGNGGAGLGHAGFTVTVTNASQQPCVTTGYPGVALLDAAGHQIEQAQRTLRGYLGGLPAGAQPATLTLHPGQQASALIEGTDFDPASGGDCPTSPALLFTLPDNTDSTTLRHDTPACTGLQIHPLIKGTSGDS